MPVIKHLTITKCLLSIAKSFNLILDIQ